MATPIPPNACPFTLAELASATAGTIGNLASESITVRGVSIDSRTIEAGALFVALKGATHNGHDYLADAARRGAGAAIVERGTRASPLPSVEVADTLSALGDLARFHLDRQRAAWPAPSIAIAGSAGKTTTKEIVAALAGALFGPILSTPGNLNNLIGVPMTLLALTGEHRALVIECGTNTRGEIARLGAILRPDATLVLNVDIEHSEGLGTIDEIAREETSLFKFTASKAVAPAGDRRILSRVPPHLQCLTFGRSAPAAVRLARRSVTSQGRSSIRIELAPALVETGVAPQIETTLALLGAQSALNAAAAVACAAALRDRPLNDAELRSIGDTLATIGPVPGRLSRLTIGGVVVIDDSYNSNPGSARAALQAAREIASVCGARLVVAMGDMLELGALSATAHSELLSEVAQHRPSAFVAVGGEMAAACESANQAGARDAATAALAAGAALAHDSQQASRLIRAIVRAGDVVLVKGSRGIRMERIIEALRAG